MDLTRLNREQLAAVRHGEGPLLLLAGAGSGKTRVITCRIAYLLQQRGVAAERLLAVTFTNKAAREMKERVVELVGRKACRGMIISTFHSLGMRILREHIERLGFKSNFSIYGEADQRRLIRDLAQSFSQHGRKIDADRVLWKISEAKNGLVSAPAFAAACNRDEDGPIAEIYLRYQQALKAYNAIDFDDILMYAVQLLQEHADLAAIYRERFVYVMVDEYQDTNAAQYRLLHLLCSGHQNLCVVGDDDQLIYGWRGADPSNILDFEKDFPGAQIIKLEQNYRSSGHVLAVANAVIQHNLKRREKKLWTADGMGAPVDYLRCDDEEDEARTVVEMIHAGRFRHHLDYRDFAVLYRTNAQSRAFEEQLRYENIPYVLIGGQQFFDRKEVKDVVAYLKVLLNPRDEVNLLRILNFPKRGIGETSADRLIRHSAEFGLPLWEVLEHAAAVPELGEKTTGAVADFVALMERYRRRFRLSGQLAATLQELIRDLALEDELYRSAEDPAKARRRVENVEEVVNAMASYQEREATPSLAGFMEKVSLLDEDRPSSGGKEAKLNQDAVVLMSLHSSKGLEFPWVFLVGMEEDYLPHKKSVGEHVDVDEERRLCYVGITRARRQLLLLNAARRKKFGKQQPRFPSRFLQEIPAEFLSERPSRDRPESAACEQEAMASDFFSGIKALLGE